MDKVLAVMLFFSGCGSAADLGSAAADGTEESIQAGAKDGKDPAVGLVWIHGGGFCSGTLIAPNVVLTAGHCVEEQVDSFYTGTGKGTASVGTLPARGVVKHAVIDQIAHPSYRSKNVCPNPTFDVALLRLAKPLSTKPVKLAAQPPAQDVTCTAVGYGVHENADSTVTVEQRRKATETVLDVGRTSVHVTMGTGIVDHGDSGGPLLCGGLITGVTSCGDDGSWPDHREAYYGRMDTIAPWVASVIANWK